MGVSLTTLKSLKCGCGFEVVEVRRGQKDIGGGMAYIAIIYIFREFTALTSCRV